MTAEKMNSAIQLIEAGNRQAAVPVLREIIKDNAGDEDAWFLLSTCMDQTEHKKFCLQSVLTINPANQQARDALAALNAPAPVPAISARPARVEAEEMEWGATDLDEGTWVKAQPASREKFSWEQEESERAEQEKAQSEKEKQEKIEWVTTAQPEKFEWERAVREEKVESRPMEPLKMDWEEADPVPIQPLKPQPVKSPSHPTPRRKGRRRQFSFFPIVAALVLFTMLAFVCFVFLMQVLTTR